MIKRLLDLTISAMLMVLTSPLFLILAILIKADSKGSVFYKPERIGQDSRPYVMYKFRTMHADAPKTWLNRFDPDKMAEFVFQETDDPRITRMGSFLRRTSLDELPNLINVFIGNMSLVGPRPEEPEIAAHYDEFQRRRLDVKPGITGLAQVSGRAELPLGETIKKDIEYVDNRSFWLDMKILALTPKAVLTQRGAI